MSLNRGSLDKPNQNLAYLLIDMLPLVQSVETSVSETYEVKGEYVLYDDSLYSSNRDYIVKFGVLIKSANLAIDIYAELYDNYSSAAVANSELTTRNDIFTRLFSSALPLTYPHDYCLRIKTINTGFVCTVFEAGMYIFAKAL